MRFGDNNAIMRALMHVLHKLCSFHGVVVGGGVMLEHLNSELL